MSILEDLSTISETTTNNSFLTLSQLLSSDLDFVNSGSRKGSRHSWHSFPARFPPELPRLFVDRLTVNGDVILDPMAGSCTTLIEAAIMGRKAVGFDIDPLSLLIGLAKGSIFSAQDLKSTGSRLLTKAYNKFESSSTKLKEELNRRFDDETKDFLDYWFSRRTQLELLAILLEIENLARSSVKNILLMLFSSIIITKSGGVTLAQDLAHTRPHKVETKKSRSAFPEFSSKLLRLVTEGCEELDHEMILSEGDARSLALPSRSVDLVVTSPPYANNAIDYMRAHKFSLVWFGYPISKLKEVRRNYIGSEGQPAPSVEILPDFVVQVIDELNKIHQHKARSLTRYFLEMRDAMREMHRVLKPERATILVVASSVLAGIDVQTHLCLAEIGKTIGFEIVGIGQRKIHRDKRMMPFSHKSSQSGIENRMHQEYVLGFWKS